MINTDNSMNIFIQGYRDISFLKSCSFCVHLCPIALFVLIVLILLFFPSIILASPTEYNLEVSINPSASEINGISRINVKAGQELLINNGGLKINYLNLNNKDIVFNKDTRTIRIIPDKNGILEISYKGFFRDNRVPYEQGSGAAQNVIDNRGISLTNMWYPGIKGLNHYKLKVILPKGYEAVSEAEGIKKAVKGDSVEFYFDFPYPLDSINLTASDKVQYKKR